MRATDSLALSLKYLLRTAAEIGLPVSFRLASTSRAMSLYSRSIWANLRWSLNLSFAPNLWTAGAPAPIMPPIIAAWNVCVILSSNGVS